jgi:hypothetical protein
MGEFYHSDRAITVFVYPQSSLATASTSSLQIATFSRLWHTRLVRMSTLPSPVTASLKLDCFVNGLSAAKLKLVADYINAHLDLKLAPIISYGYLRKVRRVTPQWTWTHERS